MTPGAPTLGELLERAVGAIGGSRADARTDAEVLLAHASGRPRHHAHAWPERRLGPAERERFEALVAERARGRPVAHLLGSREFWTFTLEVTPATLIPRPETEHLVEAVLSMDPPGTPVRVIDLGTGSGAIAIALALERPAWQVVASDTSADALAVARRNARRLGVERIEFREASWLEAAKVEAAKVEGAMVDAARIEAHAMATAVAAVERFSLLVSNPPYVADGDPHLERADLRFEPGAALRAGADGLDAIRAIVAAAPDRLLPGGSLVLEHGHEQGEAVRALLAERGFEPPVTHPDLAGHERVTAGRWPDG